MKNIIWIAILAGAALAVLNWWGKRNQLKVPDKKTEEALPEATKLRLAECGKLQAPQQAACMGYQSSAFPVPPKINLSVV